MKFWQRCLLNKNFCIYGKTTCEGGLFLSKFSHFAGGAASPPSALDAGTSQRLALLSASLSV